ncbi:unnamed protein product [Caenorhabditis bovis]|uniref:Uncharacterized protein n=1 Tax=Caenorhabditis bovis TaxID=2654633 RepID=A0A8S1EZT0_9PELO|nr:unnamed protein product [Caenorhabditis bovis]
MAELAKPKKEKDKKRTAPLIPKKPDVINGFQLPEAPSHALIERSASPEPEEQPPIPNRSLIAQQYPTVPELSELPSYCEPLQPQMLPKCQESSEKFKVAVAPPMYPSISCYEKDEYGLMTEGHLINFYHNRLYELADDYVDRFIANEEVPVSSGVLFPLLKRFKETCDHMEITEISEKENTTQLQACLQAVWKSQQFSQKAVGKCGENRDGTGTAMFTSFTIEEHKIQELKRLLSENRCSSLDHKLCDEASFRSLALQIAWIIININSCFMMENGLNAQCPPLLIPQSIESPNRLNVRRALSDLFYHLRYPRLGERYKQTIVNWITELICVINMHQTCEDGIFVLSHILRLPSPIHDWAPQFVQTFIQSNSSPKLKLDYCLALMTHLLNPIKAREIFLRHVAQSEKEESTWEILEEGDDDDPREFSFVNINELDLISLLDQLPISEIYSAANLAFFSYNDKTSEMTSLIAFQILLMKVLDNGLTNYSKPGYRMFCKRIGKNLKQSVCELCRRWSEVKYQIPNTDEQFIQKEVDRIVLLGLNYLIHRDSIGLFQFVISLPYDVVSEECRIRCEFVLRSEKKMSIHEIYGTPISEVQAKKSLVKMMSRFHSLSPQDREFLVNSIATIQSYSSSDASEFFKEIIDVCFCDLNTRNEMYKVGGEAIGEILSRKPGTLDQLLVIIDRNLQHMDAHAINVLSTSKLGDCRLSESMISIIGKWLINNPPEHGGNRLARRVLAGLHWGPDADGLQLFIDAGVHALAADTIVKAHSVHCSKSNSMIAKSIKQIAKLASKVGDAETHFQQFCWDLLVKLKLPKVSTISVQNDLTAHYVKIVQCYEENITTYLENAVPLLSNLVSSGSSVACVVLISRLIAQHYEKHTELGSNKAFMAVFEQVLHVDQLSYAVQWLSVPSETPTPVVRLLSSGIAYYSNRVPERKEFIRAWMHLLCCSRNGWNEDAVTYQIAGTLVRQAIIHDVESLYELPEMLHKYYKQQLAAEKAASRGLFTVFSSDISPSPLIPDSMLRIAPAASYIMLLVEKDAFSTFYDYLFDNLGKKEKNKLEHSVKKASTKSSISLPVDRLAVFRWVKLATKCNDSVILPLILQQVTIEAYKLRSSGMHTQCFARKLIDATDVQPIMTEFRKAIEECTLNTKGLTRAVLGWIFTTHNVTRNGFNFSVFDLDYLLQLVLAGDNHPWMDYVDIAALNSEEINEQKLYSVTCQHDPKPSFAFPTKNEIINSPKSVALPFPILPVHKTLPKAPEVESNALFRPNCLMQMVTPYIGCIKDLATNFMECGDQMELFDEKYVELINKLYQPTKQSISVQIRCDGGCSRPKSCVIDVSTNVFSAATNTEVAKNREKRVALWNDLYTGLVDKTAHATASFEHLARIISNLAMSMNEMNRSRAQTSGSQYFHLLVSSVGDHELLYKPAVEAYTNSLREIGKEFIRLQPGEQIDVMKIALDGVALYEPIVELFTPEVLNSKDLCAAYTKLSEAVRTPEKSNMALQLLGMSINRKIY